MSFVTNHPINARWPAQNPDILQLYSFPTPNGVKASIMLEETGLAYEAHKVMLSDDEVKSVEFTSLNPNGKIPAIIDPDGPGGAPVELFESGAILIYLAEKTGKLLSVDPLTRYQTIQWLMFQMGGIGPMFGQLGFFYKFAGAEIEDKRPVERYLGETRRLLGVLDGALEGKDWVMGEFSIADIAIAPWVRALDFYEATDAVGFDDFENVDEYLDRFLERPAVKRGLNIPPRD
ncbi:glutathione S-transferase N-terminal domain-containing protein [Alisedimentitalea sp. MJ-SS2]|uniref:glutathione S-transferase family protein n=1 Tax=Aliisedimentitalea sp. MJ-SS2 TaxID=3049795 RepID=UPI00291076DF|nr:glutathione binding-like protein [Alisedimentitalea sp. MJ-SS2]MDU8927784.1 glutathione S-transferase N-terminal domain-containing protein [Alisedimentitalea sp. MJ-SS2]